MERVTGPGTAAKTLREQLCELYGVEKLTAEQARHHGVWGLHLGTIKAREGHRMTCNICGAVWFLHGLHRSDCEKGPKRLPLKSTL